LLTAGTASCGSDNGQGAADDDYGGTSPREMWVFVISCFLCLLLISSHKSKLYSGGSTDSSVYWGGHGRGPCWNIIKRNVGIGLLSYFLH
jgi:hypothetical protein